MQQITRDAAARRRLPGLAGLAMGLAAGIAAAAALSPAAGAAEQISDRTAIAHVLERSAAGWSSNDLDAFMSAYENAAGTTYLKGETVVHGYAAIRTMYAARFAGAGAGAGASAAMGRLSLSVLEVRRLGRAYALCIGTFRLDPHASSGGAHGIFTLVFHQTQDGWKIVSDHTSS